MDQRSKPHVENRTGIPYLTPPLRPHQSSLAESLPGDPPSKSSSSGEDADSTLQMEGVYIISVAARILDMHPQTLRKYERLGLIRPGRTLGMLRLYSSEDIRKLRLIRHLVGHLGLNLAGVEFALSMVDDLLHLKERLAALTEGTSLEKEVQQEIARLFQRMDLPAGD